MPHQPGSKIGPYTLADKIGEGGMGEVYRATDTKLRRDVAIKLLPESLTQDGRPTVQSNRQRVPVEDVESVRWALDGDELFAITTDGQVFVVALERHNSSVRMGGVVRLFDLPVSGASHSFAVTADRERFFFLLDPEAHTKRSRSY